MLNCAQANGLYHAIMKRSQFEKHLKRHGCQLHHHGGNHDVWINPATQAKSPLPRHREYNKKGTVRAICKALGIPEPTGLG